MSHSRSHSVASSSSLEIIDDEELRNVMEEERQVFLQDSTNQRQESLQDSTNQRQESLQDQTNQRQVSLQDPTNQRQVSLQDPSNHNSIEEIVEGLENAAKGITVSNVNPQQVVFEDVKDTYTDTIQVRVVSKGDVLDVGDVVGVFRTPFLDIKECLTASQIIIDQDNKLKGSVKLTRLDDLTEKEFYQFQYLRQAKNAEDGEILHTICGASVPWQFVKSMTEHAVEPEGSVATWDMEKYNQIEKQIWSPDSSRLTEMCIAEQIKEFITPLDPAIQVRFISHLLNQVKSDPALYKSCSVYNKIYRIFHLMANMELNCIVDQAPVKNLDQLILKMLEKIRETWDADYAMAEYNCALTGKLGCQCGIDPRVFKNQSTVREQDEKQQNVLAGWSYASVLQNSSSSSSSNSYLSTSSVGPSLEDQVSELKKENENLKKDFESLDSSIQVLEDDKRTAQNSLAQMSYENLSAKNSLTQMSLDKDKFEHDIKNILQKEATKASQNHLEKEKLQGELNVLKKVLDDCVKDKAEMCGKLEVELEHREQLISRIEQLEAAQDKLEQEKVDLLDSKEKLSNELLHVNQMLEAAQISKEAAATLSREEQAPKLSQQQEVTQQSLTDSSWVQCKEDSIPDGVDKDLVKVFSSLGVQLEEARAKIKQLEDALRAKDLELKESFKFKEVSKETAIKGKEEIKADVEAEVAEKMKALEMKSQEAVKALETRTLKLESVQDELKRFMDNNMEQMSNRLSLLAEENKACEMKIQKLESDPPSEAWTGDRDGSLSVSSRGSLASSCASNMNSIKIASELSNNTRRDDAQLSNLRQYFLPDPLVPEKLDTEPGIPELRRREPSRYSMSSSLLEASSRTLDARSSTDPPHWLKDGKCIFCEEFVRQSETESEEYHICGKETEMDKAHKKQKDLLKKDVPFCPICFITFDKSKEKELKRHVNTHFQDQADANDSFLHLGID